MMGLTPHILNFRNLVAISAAIGVSTSALATQPPRYVPGAAAISGAQPGAGARRAGVAPPVALRPDVAARLREILSYNTTRGLTGVVNRAADARSASFERAARAARGIGAGPPITRPTAVKGTWRIPVLMVTFSDTPTDPYPVANLQKQLFDGPWPTRTMTEYYREVSGGRLEVRGTVYPWIKLPKPESYYAGPNGCHALCDHPGFGEMLVDTMTAAASQIDFRQYDNDGPDGVPDSGDDDGHVDFVAIVHPSTGGECGNSNSIWSHRWTMQNRIGRPFETNNVGRNGQKILIDDYVVMPALSCNGRTMIEIGVFAHEFGHAFGLPDLYDTSQKSHGIGTWGLMGAGSWGGDGRTPHTPTHMSAWEKEYLGWTQSRVISEDTRSVVLRAGAGGTGPLRVDIDEDKALLIEHRAKSGFDQSLTAEGLLVWRVKNSVIQPGMRNNRVNADRTNKGLGLIEADGLQHLDDVSSPGGGPGDVFPGTANRTTLDSTTTPTSEGNIALCNIRSVGTSVTLDIIVSRSTCAASSTVTLGSSVLFDTGSPTLKPAAESALTAVATRIKATANARVVVHGHTDSVGEPANNQALSERRAEAVKTWLVNDGGIAAQSIGILGHGDKRLVNGDGKPVSDPSEENRAKSRRVEIEISSGLVSTARP